MHIKTFTYVALLPHIALAELEFPWKVLESYHLSVEKSSGQSHVLIAWRPIAREVLLLHVLCASAAFPTTPTDIMNIFFFASVSNHPN